MATKIFTSKFFLNPLPVLRNSPRHDDLATMSVNRLGAALVVIGRTAMRVAPFSGTVDELERARHGVANVNDAWFGGRGAHAQPPYTSSARTVGTIAHDRRAAAHAVQQPPDGTWGGTPPRDGLSQW